MSGRREVFEALVGRSAERATHMSQPPRHSTTPAPDTPDRFLSRADCLDLIGRAAQLAHGGGMTWAAITSDWRGNIRWGRNELSGAGDTRNTTIELTRSINGAKGTARINETNSVDLEAAVRRAERFLTLADETGTDAKRRPANAAYPTPAIWSDATYAFDARQRVTLLKQLIQPVVQAGMLSTGYIEVTGQGAAHVVQDGQCMYMPHTMAQCSVTVRDPEGTGSGWAGMDHHDWSRIDPSALVATALHKCLTSRNPVAIEPGRYTAILEPQAVCDLTSILFGPVLDRSNAERGNGPYAGSVRGMSKIGSRIADPRIIVTADPMDPELGYVPFDTRSGEVYRPAVWIDHGVLNDLSYDTDYAVQMLHRNNGLPSNGAFHLHGGTTTVDEMIASTERGVLVTRFSNIIVVENAIPLLSGFTRDGLWLIEKGKISKPIKNFRFVESPLFALSNVVQLGAPVRVFHPDTPVVVPPLKVTDFNFASLADAV